VGKGPQTKCRMRSAKLSGASAQQGSLEQMRKRAAPSSWMSLEIYASSRSTKKLESTEMDDE